MKNLSRTVRVGFVVGVLFFGWYLRDIYLRNWHFHLFSSDSWSHVLNEFKSGWVISSPYEWSWLITVLLMFPVFFILWWMSCKISWRKSLKTVIKAPIRFFHKPNPKKVINKKIKLKAKASHKKVRPPHMTPGGRPAVKQTGRTMDADKTLSAQPQPAFQPMSAGFSTPPTFAQSEQTFTDREQPPFLDDEINNIALDDIHLPERIRLEEDLVAILSQANYQVVADAVIEKLKLTYVGISSDKIVLCLADIDKGDWLADEEFFNDEEPLWFSESSHRISPVYSLLTTAKGFAKKIAEAGLSQEVIPMLIEKEGTIINATDMFETWKKMGVVVCRTDLGGPEELPSFASALPKAQDKDSADMLETVRNLF